MTQHNRHKLEVFFQPLLKQFTALHQHSTMRDRKTSTKQFGQSTTRRQVIQQQQLRNSVKLRTLELSVTTFTS